MPVCSYLVVPSGNAAPAVRERLEALTGCEVVPAENHDLLLLVTDTAGPEEERALQATVSGIEGIGTLVLVFGEVEPGAPL